MKVIESRELKRINEKLQEISALSFLVSNTTKTDVIFVYCGHTNTIDIRYYKNGYDSGEKIINIALCKNVNDETADFIIEELKKLLF